MRMENSPRESIAVVREDSVERDPPPPTDLTGLKNTTKIYCIIMRRLPLKIDLDQRQRRDRSEWRRALQMITAAAGWTQDTRRVARL